MNIWAWVEKTQEQLRESGNPRLAELMDLLPEYATESQHANLDAVYPEALALARASRNPWIEIFVRHWNMQSRVLVRCQAKTSIEEAVSLAEFASREEHQACPQSVCVIQDLTSCYASFDGPGYSAERISVCQETLERIDASWPCFVCIASEYSDALVDAEEYEQALEFLDEKIVQVRSRQASDLPRLARKRFDILYAMGRFEEAQQCAQEAMERAEDSNAHTRARIQKAAAMTAQGLLEEAWEELPSWELVEPTPSRYRYYDEAVLAVALKSNPPRQSEIFHQLTIMEREYERHGYYRSAFEVALRRAELSLARGHRILARACWERAGELSQNLVLPLKAPKQLESLSQRLEEEQSSTALPEELDELELEGLEPGEQLETLQAACERWPEYHWRLQLGKAWRGAGFMKKAYDLIDEQQHGKELAFWLLCDYRLEEFDDLIQRLLAADIEVGQRCHLLFLRAQSERDREQWEASIKTLREVLGHQPEARNTRYLLSDSYRRVGDYESALEMLSQYCELEGPGDRDWDRMVVATWLERWDVVRDSAGRLGIELTGEDGPIQEWWGVIKVQLEEPDGRRLRWYANRTGPVTARVAQMSHPGTEAVRYGDEVLFEPTPLPRESDEDTQVTYHTLKLLKAGNYQIFPIDGVHPGPEALEGIGDEFPDGLVLRNHSNESYMVKEGELQGFFASLAVPPTLELHEVHSLLLRLSASWEHPWLWPGLAEAAGLSQEVARMQSLAQDYGIECG